MPAPRLSIGLPIYNAAAAASTAIERLLSQEFSDFELIISDNASTDGTPDICAAYARLDERIRFQRQPRNVGINRNFDDVLALARGELFMWTAHDDRADRSFIRRCVAALASTPDAVLAMTDIVIVDERGRSRVHTLSDDIAHHDPVRRVSWILSGGAWIATYGVIRRSALARTRSVSTLPGRPCGVASDYRIVELGMAGPFVRISEPLFEYHYREITSLEDLTKKIDPDGNPQRGVVWWWLQDLWRMGNRHGLTVAQRLRIQAACIRSRNMHTVFLFSNRELRRWAWRDRRWRDYARFLMERAMLGPRR